MTIQEQIISLDNLRFYAYHGVEPQEQVVGAWFTVEVTLHVNVDDAILHDTLENTIDYSTVATIIEKEMAVKSKLLEHVAGRIAASLLKQFPTLRSLTLTVSKENPPFHIPCSRANFTITASK